MLFFRAQQGARLNTGGCVLGARLNSSIPLSELTVPSLRGLLYYLYIHYAELDPCIYLPEISISLIPISLCHSLAGLILGLLGPKAQLCS